MTTPHSLKMLSLLVGFVAWGSPFSHSRFAQIYRCPFLTSFRIEIETSYMDDAGEQDNVFGLSSRELKERVVGGLFDLLSETRVQYSISSALLIGFDLTVSTSGFVLTVY